MTTPDYTEGARYVLGAIRQIFVDNDGDALASPWHGSMYVNSGTGAHRDVIVSLWRCANEHARLGDGPVLWLGHDLTQLSWLHHCAVLADGTPCHGPISWPIVVSCWQERRAASSYVCLLGGEPDQCERFRDWFGELGSHSEPLWPPSYGRILTREILQALRMHGPMSKRNIARVIQARKVAVSRAVDQLARAGRIRPGHGWSWVCQESQLAVQSEGNR